MCFNLLFVMSFVFCMKYLNLTACTNLQLWICFSLNGPIWKKVVHRNHSYVWSKCLSQQFNVCVQCRLFHLSLKFYKKRKTADDRVSTFIVLDMRRKLNALKRGEWLWLFTPGE
jgi:hypothetical protein